MRRWPNFSSWLAVVYGVLSVMSMAAVRADDVELHLRVIHLAYTLHALDHGSPPEKPEDLAKFFEANPDESAALEKVRRGEYVVVWKEPRVTGETQGERVLLAHESAAATQGGSVLFADGTLRRLTAGEFAAASGTGSAGALRTWTDSTGKYRTEAALIGRNDGNVQLRKKDGTTVWLSVEKLSVADREYLRSPAVVATEDPVRSVQNAVQEAIGIIEAKQYKLCLLRFVRPQDLQQMLGQPPPMNQALGISNGPAKASLQDLSEAFGAMPANLTLAALKAVRDRSPTIEDSGKQAVFDLSGVEMPPQFRKERMVFVRHGSRWCLLDR